MLKRFIISFFHFAVVGLRISMYPRTGIIQSSGWWSWDMVKARASTTYHRVLNVLIPVRPPKTAHECASAVYPDANAQTMFFICARWLVSLNFRRTQTLIGKFMCAVAVFNLCSDVSIGGNV